jgi:subtilisin family serine protease
MRHRSSKTPPRLRSAAIVALLISLIGQTIALAAPADGGATSNHDVFVAKKVRTQLAEEGKATFWVVMEAEADLSAAAAIKSWTDRGTYVYQQLTSTAATSQKSIQQFLRDMGASFKSYWIVNGLRVSATEAVVSDLEQRSDVDSILPVRTYRIPEPGPGKTEPKVNTVEWNIERVRAPEVWSTFGTRGEGIVVANVDTGVDFQHAALVNQYRGRQSDGTFDHNYNWVDPSNICGNPSLVPCDNNGHGTHTMGTMVGDDGPGGNQIGVAPNAKWIAAKGCETNSCSDLALTEAGQWIAAPTDLSGQNPRPDLRPNIVNNSWGGGPGDAWYQSIVQSWVAAGIFPAFSNGNAGPSCGSAGSPGDYAESYAAGAFDINNVIAGFSSRGPSAFGGITKPNIAAPGVNVRSSVPGGYAAFNGTSMASPHVAGTVALMWSAAPAIFGDIDSTRTLLDTTAVDTDDASCGGTPENNNVWGEGRLDAFLAVEQAPRGPTGTLTGTVTDAGSGTPIAGATVTAVGPDTERSTTTDAAGAYDFTLPVGDYEVTVESFGYVSQTVTVTIAEGGETVQDFALALAPSHSVSGTVTDEEGNPLAGVPVTILGTPLEPAITDAAGMYSFAAVPEGEYEVQVDGGGCLGVAVQTLVVDGDEVLDFQLQPVVDAFGYMCEPVEAEYVEANTVLPLTGDDAVATVDLPFSFPFYGASYSQAHVASNGFLNFLAPDATFTNSSIPSAATPNAAIYPFWDDFIVDADSSVRTESLGTAPDRSFVIEWRNVHFFDEPTKTVDFEVVLHENGRILTKYRSIAEDGREQGNSATVGIENHAGDTALQYSFGEASLRDGLAVLYRVPNAAIIEGNVIDANDGLGIAGATVTATSSEVSQSATTDAEGFYRMQVPLGTYEVTATATNYSTESAEVTLDEEDEVVTQDFTLTTAIGDVSPDSLEFIIPEGETRTAELTLENSGSADLTWEIKEAGGGTATVESSRASIEIENPNAKTSKALAKEGDTPPKTPAAPGDIIKSWTPTGMTLAWGVGYTGNVWLSDGVATGNKEFTVDGAETGRSWPTPWNGVWPGDMAYVDSLGLMCQVNVGGDNGIYCWDPDTGEVVESITGSFPWTGISQRGLAYRPDDDSFYIGGWNEGIVYHVAGLSHPTPGEVLGQCNPADPNISGLAWNYAFNILWSATNSLEDTIYQLNPDTCETLGTLEHPTPGFQGAGLEMDETGNLWTIGQAPNTAYLIDSGVPAFTDVPWISEDPTSGTVPPGGSQTITVTVDTTGLEPGVHTATLFFQTDAGRQPNFQVPVEVIVPAYRQGVNSAGNEYVDGASDTWAADQEWTAGSWGYFFNTGTLNTNQPIEATDDDPLYQRQRSARHGSMEYRFDGLPSGRYQVELLFAELKNWGPNRRLFDVLVESQPVLLGYDISGSVGTFTADRKEFFVDVTDGQLVVRFLERAGFGKPVINALRVTHRPDM